MGISLILWLSMPCMLTVFPVLAMTQMSSPAIPPLAPQSTRELLLPAAWHDEMTYVVEDMSTMLTCLYMMPFRLTSWGWFGLESLLAAGDRSRLALPGGRGFFLVICARRC